MSCEHLVCAACAGPVVEGRCPVCREARSKVHHHGLFGLSPQALVLIAAIVMVLVVLMEHLRG